MGQNKEPLRVAIDIQSQIERTQPPSPTRRSVPILRSLNAASYGQQVPSKMRDDKEEGSPRSASDGVVFVGEMHSTSGTSVADSPESHGTPSSSISSNWSFLQSTLSLIVGCARRLYSTMEIRLRSPIFRTFLGVGLLLTGVICAVLFLPLTSWSHRFILWTLSLGALAPFLFSFIIFSGTVLCLPVAIFTYAANGGNEMKGINVSARSGSLLGAIGAFAVGKSCLQPCSQAVTKKYSKFGVLDRAVSTNAWKIVFLVRLSPIVPFFFMNYILSLTQVPFLPYCASTAFGLIMPTAMFVYMGSAARDLNDIFENPTNQGSMVLLSIGAMTVFSALLAGRIAAKAIQQEMEKASECLATTEQDTDSALERESRTCTVDNLEENLLTMLEGSLEPDRKVEIIEV